MIRRHEREKRKRKDGGLRAWCEQAEGRAEQRRLKEDSVPKEHEHREKTIPGSPSLESDYGAYREVVWSRQKGFRPGPQEMGVPVFPLP